MGQATIVAGMATPAMSAITAGANTNVPTCQITIFFRLHTCLPQNVPEQQKVSKKNNGTFTFQFELGIYSTDRVEISVKA